MSALNNRHWIAYSGEPVTGRTPPELIVYGPKMTGEQEGQVRHIYKLFTDACLVSISGHQVRQRLLGDGTRVRCASFMGKDVVEVWTVGGEETEQLVGGFISRPQGSNLVSPEYWGKPFTEATKPLGTLFGEDPQVLIQTKWSNKLKAATGDYKVNRGIPDTYGAVDWKGREPDDGVLTWDAEDLGQGKVTLFDEPEGDTPSAVSFVHTGWMSSTVSPDAQKQKTIVRRYRSKGTGTKVYSQFVVVGEYTGGVVNGAAIYSAQLPSGGTRKMIVAAITNPESSSPTTFVTTISGEQVTIGATPALGRPLHGWYFSSDGTKARCTFLTSPTQTAVYEVTLSGYDEPTFDLTHSALANPGAMSVAETYKNETQYESGYTYNITTETLSVESGDTIETPDGWPYENSPRTQTTKQTTGLTQTETGSRVYESPFLAADFAGETGVVAFVRCTAEKVEGVGLSRLVTYSTVSGGTTVFFTGEESYNWTGTYTPEKIEFVARNSLSAETVTPLQKWTNAPFSYALGSATTPATFPLGNFERNAVMDFDLRADAVLVRTVRLTSAFFQDANFPGETGPLLYEDALSGVFAGEYASGTQAVSARVLQSGVEVLSKPAYMYAAPLGNMKSFAVETFALEVSSVAQKITRHKKTLIEFMSVMGDEPYLVASNTLTEGGSTRFVGVLREYYGLYCSTFVSLSSAESTSREELFGGLISGNAGTDVFSILQMSDKTRPILYRLSVI